MTNEPLSTSRDNFQKILGIFFPNIYDLKSFAKEFSIDGGLGRIGDMLGI